jgi:hypothetical protein
MLKGLFIVGTLNWHGASAYSAKRKVQSEQLGPQFGKGSWRIQKKADRTKSIAAVN